MPDEATVGLPLFRWWWEPRSQYQMILSCNMLPFSILNRFFPSLSLCGTPHQTRIYKWREPELVYVTPRTGLDKFLEQIAEHFDIEVFTVGTEEYTNTVLDIIDSISSTTKGSSVATFIVTRVPKCTRENTWRIWATSLVISGGWSSWTIFHGWSLVSLRMPFVVQISVPIPMNGSWNTFGGLWFRWRMWRTWGRSSASGWTGGRRRATAPSRWAYCAPNWRWRTPASKPWEYIFLSSYCIHSIMCISNNTVGNNIGGSLHRNLLSTSSPVPLEKYRMAAGSCIDDPSLSI